MPKGRPPAASLAAVGVPVETFSVEGGGHALQAAGVAVAGQFLTRALGEATG